jgi:hypothetical protein
MATPELCEVSMTTSRDMNGDEAKSRIDEVPCSEIQITLSELEFNDRQSIWVEVKDQHTNTAMVQVLGSIE